MSSSGRRKPRILCVDDEPQILEGLALHVRRHYEMSTATSGAAGLEVLAREPDTAVVMSDMRMPGMDGATFLAHARTAAPDAVRLLLTGQSDIGSAIAAINEGQIFRFLTKPCPPPTLLAALSAAMAQHQLVMAERVLLEQTLHGSIEALTGVLGVVSPAAFGRAARVKQLVSELADRLALRERWQVEVAAMLSQLGHITLPPEVAERVYFGRWLSLDEQQLVERLPAVTEQLLAHIPRLEEVREILRTYPLRHHPPLAANADPAQRRVALGAQLLRLAVDFDALESREEASLALDLETLQARVGLYEPEVLQALLDVRGARQAAERVEVLPAHALRVGMVLAQDVKLDNGTLLVARGYEIGDRFLERILSFAPGVVDARFHVLVAAGSQ